MGDKDRRDAAAQRRQQLFFQPANGQRIAAQRDLARHGDVFAHGDARDDGYNRRHHGQTRRWAIFWRGPFGHMHVDVHGFKLGRFDPQFWADRAHIRCGCFDGFLHHIAQFTSGFHPPLAGQTQRFDLQQLAADRCIGKPRDNANLIGQFCQTIPVAAHAKEAFQFIGGHFHRFRGFLDNFRHRFARQLGNFAFQIAHPRLAGIAADHFGQRGIGHAEFTFFQRMAFYLLGNQMTLGNLALFILGIARQGDNLHPVQQRGRHVIAVGRGDKHHVRQIILHL